jgi:hypothetical protein
MNKYNKMPKNTKHTNKSIIYPFSDSPTMGSWHSNTSMAFERSFSMEIRDATHISMICVLDFVEINL